MLNIYLLFYTKIQPLLKNCLFFHHIFSVKFFTFLLNKKNLNNTEKSEGIFNLMNENKMKAFTLYIYYY